MANNSATVPQGTKNQAVKAVEVTQNNQGANTINVQSRPIANNVDKPKRVYRPQPVYQVLRKARLLFRRQLEQSSETKAKCIDAALAASPDLYPDKLRFELDFRAERERLTDSKRFCSECEALKKVPEYVADHAVFEGRAMVEKTLRLGVRVSLGEFIHMYVKPLWKDSQKLYSSEGGHEVPQEDVKPEAANA